MNSDFKVRVTKGWLYRKLVFTYEGEEFVVAYNGREFVPVFIFTIFDRAARLEVRVWPWIATRSLRLFLENKEIYAEGT